ncbi:gag-pol polyprotein [Tanacetum coccineum]
MIINFINHVQRNLKALILKIRTDNGTEFKNKKLRSFYAKLGIVHNTSIAQTSQQNGVVERRNQYYATSTPKVLDNSAANTLDNEDTPSSSSIVVEEDEAPQIVSSSAEPVATEPNTPDPSNMHEFHQIHRSTDKWTKNHPIEQVIGDPSKPTMTRRRLHTDAEVCMKDEPNQFKCLDVWELVECLVGRNIITVKWIWKNKTDAENTVI